MSRPYDPRPRSSWSVFIVAAALAATDLGRVAPSPAHAQSLPMPARDVVVVVDPTTASTGDADAAVRADRLRAALAVFAGRFGSIGGRLGAVRAACPPALARPMASGVAAHDAWRADLRAMVDATAADLPGAIGVAGDALAGLPPSAWLAAPVVVVVDAGGAACPAPTPAPPPAAIDVCRLADGIGAVVVVIALPASTGRLRSCNSPGWYFRSKQVDGSDLAPMLDEIADRLARLTDPAPAATGTATPFPTPDATSTTAAPGPVAPTATTDGGADAVRLWLPWASRPAR